MRNFFYTVFILFFSNLVYAVPHYTIIIDAAKFSSILHLYTYDDASLPMIQELFSAKSTQALRSFADHPEKAGESLGKILSDANYFLIQQHIPPASVSLSVMGTDGMRKLSLTKQAEIYWQVKKYLEQQTSFSIRTLATLSGKKQGVDEWLTVNYLEGNLATKNNLIGVIDVGDDTMQVAFATEGAIAQDEVQVDINHKTYHIVSENFSGLGLDEIIQQLNHTKNDLTCYQTGNYIFAACENIFRDLLTKHYFPTLSSQNTIFAVTNHAADVLQFFGVEDGTGAALVARIGDICPMSWEAMQQEYADSGIPVEKLFTLCASGIYLDALFYHTDLNGPALWVTHRAHNGKRIDWVLGEILDQKASFLI